MKVIQLPMLFQMRTLRGGLGLGAQISALVLSAIQVFTPAQIRGYILDMKAHLTGNLHPYLTRVYQESITYTLSPHSKQETVRLIWRYTILLLYRKMAQIIRPTQPQYAQIAIGEQKNLKTKMNLMKFSERGSRRQKSRCRVLVSERIFSPKKN